MSKQDTILKNLKQLTGRRKLSTACQGWVVLNSIDIKSASLASCELCGTPFKRGAMMRSGDVTISVGGVCLSTMLRGRFSDKPPSDNMAPAMKAKVEAAYTEVCDPGGWFNWLFRRSVRSRKIAPLVWQLRCGEEISPNEMKELIDYHDMYRLYPIDALFPYWRRLKKIVKFPLKQELTLKQARALLKKQGSVMVRPESDEYEREELQALINNDIHARQAYMKLTAEAKRVVIALCKLADSAEEDELVCEQGIADNFNPVDLPPRPPQWVWNQKKGIGVLDRDAAFGGNRAELWLWRTGKYERNLYDLTFWLDVQPRDTSKIGLLEVTAFSTIPL